MAVDDALGSIDQLIELAHDVRTPLTSILFLADTLRSGMSGPTTPLQEHQLGLIYAAAFELSSLANDITELSHGGDELLERQAVPFSIRNVLQSVHDIVLPLAESRGIELRLTHPVSDRRLGHPAALGRVLLNLVTNALKGTSTGFVEISAVTPAEGRTLFAVRDTGEGIAPELLAELIDSPYAPRRKLGRGFASAGLGLAICRRLVTRMGGELKVTTAPQSGSSFYFELALPPAATP